MFSQILKSRVLVSFFGLGLSPVAPGTVGSLGALLLYSWLGSWVQPGPLLVTTIVLCIFSYYLIYAYEKASGSHDQGLIVIDEVCGIFVTMSFVPQADTVLLGVGFVLFRFFDILKPFPVGWIDRNMQNSLGTWLDDIIAGVMAGVSLLCFSFLI